MGIVNHHLAEGEAGDRDELEISNCQGDTDDGDCLEKSSDDMRNCQPETCDDEPHEIHQRGSRTRPGNGNNALSKGPQNVACNTEACDSCGDGDDKNTGDNSGQNVAQE